MGRTNIDVKTATFRDFASMVRRSDFARSVTDLACVHTTRKNMHAESVAALSFVNTVDEKQDVPNVGVRNYVYMESGSIFVRNLNVQHFVSMVSEEFVVRCVKLPSRRFASMGKKDKTAKTVILAHMGRSNIDAKSATFIDFASTVRRSDFARSVTDLVCVHIRKRNIGAKIAADLAFVCI